MKSILASFGAVKQEPQKSKEIVHDNMGENIPPVVNLSPAVNLPLTGEDIPLVVNIPLNNSSIYTTREENTTIDGGKNTTDNSSVNPTPIGKFTTLSGEKNTTSILPPAPSEDEIFMQCGSITNYGYYCLLRRKILENNGIIRINAFCKYYSCDKKALLLMIKRLEEKGLFCTLSSGPEGRKLALIGGKNTTGGIYFSTCSSSNYLNKQQQIQNSGKNTTDSENTPRGQFSSGAFEDFLNTLSLTAQLDSSSFSSANGELVQAKSAKLPSWEKAQLQAQAEDLFYVTVAAKVDPDALSMQTVSLYGRITKERGRDYTAALFLILLPKARDNPTGYISSAFKRGAEPTSASIGRVKGMWELLDVLSKTSTFLEIRQQIREAVEKDDTDAITELTQQQTQIKAALRVLSWDRTPEELTEKRNAFVASLFGG
jgi:hypothetical protein